MRDAPARQAGRRGSLFRAGPCARMGDPAMSGRLYVIGLGPGNEGQLTPEASAAISVAREFFGYKPYVERLVLREGQLAHASDNREELSRASAALARAAEGLDVAVVSGGD